MSQLQPPLTNPDGYSATVRLFLRLPDQTIPLTHLGSSTFRCREPLNLLPGPATLEIQVDGRVSTTDIVIEPADLPAQEFDYDLQW